MDFRDHSDNPASLLELLTKDIRAIDGITGCAIVARDNSVLARTGVMTHELRFHDGCDTETGRQGHEGILISVPVLVDGEAGACILAELAMHRDDRRIKDVFFVLKALARLLPPVVCPQAAPIEVKSGFVGSSEGLRQVIRQIGIVAPAHTTVLLQGESGTGKELAARAIHNSGPTPGGPFVSLNCAALPENLIESELFGHERGAFTGADRMRRGRFELANGGTLFLDEIGELGPGIQAKLLRALQERVFERLGGMTTISFDGRVVAATNRNLQEMVESGEFRRDLYYRLNVFAIRIPPLRERREDILPLAAHFLARHRPNVRFSGEACAALRQYDWPGNAREVENVMERAALLLGPEPVLEPEHLPPEMRLATADESGVWPVDLKRKVAALETDVIRAALINCGGRINRAAAMTGLTPREFGLRICKYGINYRQYRR